jgi:uncharacterized protein (DUF2062 family)
MRFNRKYILNVLSDALRRGTTPRQLALTCALGIVISIFPFIGVTTWICLGLALVLRLNIAIIQLVNYLFFPIQLLLMIPFINMGTFLFSLNPFPYTQEQLINLFKTDFWRLASEAGISVGSGIAVWGLVAIPLFFLVFYTTFIVFSKWRRPANAN